MIEEKDIDKFENENEDKIYKVKHLSGMYENWFLDYASYVILERAVPHVIDGLKPVQRRILHSMKRLDDGRYNKVANIIGHTMQFHPHGDASIGDALVQLGQKDLLIDMQGNWGNIFTGDGAAAPRYIEARLTKFALEIAFNPKTTKWKLSYDGRNNEPINLPMKFPLLLAQGVEGIAVGLASKILPHNFIELIDASIAYLKNEPFELFPDFPTGGLIDVSKYNDGIRGGKVRVRAKISKLDKKTLVITDLPFGKNTGNLIDSILSANDKGKIKIRKIDDNTAEFVEIQVHLLPGAEPDKTIDALFAFTDCEVSISPNSCVIQDDKPAFLGVSDILKLSTDSTLFLLKRELEIRLEELEDDWHNSSLEKIFIENRIYFTIENCETWESIISTIDKGLEPFKHLLRREVVEEDIVRLTEIKIKRISKFDAFKADEFVKGLEVEMKKVKHNLKHIVVYTINYFERIKNKYAAGKERKTEIRCFDVIEAVTVVEKNEKLFLDWENGFVGTGLKKDTYICDCSDMDDIIFFRPDGTYMVTKVSEKFFVGKKPLHVAIYKKNDIRTIYNAVYHDGKSGHTFWKRFAVSAITRDKEYNVTQGHKHSFLWHLTANPNGEAETIRVTLKYKPRIQKLNLEFDFATIAIKGRHSMGNILTKHAIHLIKQKSVGESTLGGRKIWFDNEVLRLNSDGRGKFLGEFQNDEKVLVVMENGQFFTTSCELTNHYDPGILLIDKFDSSKIYTLAFYDGEQDFAYLKRFNLELSEREQSIIGDHTDSKVLLLTDKLNPFLEVYFGGMHKKRKPEIVNSEEFIAVKGYKARGKRLTNHIVTTVELVKEDVKEPEILPIVPPTPEEPLNKEVEFEIVRPNKENSLFDI